MIVGAATSCPAFGAPDTQPASADAGTSSLLSLTAPTAPSDESDVNRYGPFGIYDHRSLYGKGVFPEPFIVDDSDGEVNEFRVDWSHQRGKGQNDNIVTVELEHGNGLWTLELEVPYEYDTSNT